MLMLGMKQCLLNNGVNITCWYLLASYEIFRFKNGNEHMLTSRSLAWAREHTSFCHWWSAAAP